MGTAKPAKRSRSSVGFRIAVGLAVVGLGEAAGAVWLGLAHGDVKGFTVYSSGQVASDLAFAPFPVMAAVIARQQPHNRYWVLLALGGGSVAP
jgi:hypothetical protein